MMNGAAIQNDLTWLMSEPGKIAATIIVLIAIGLVALALEYLRMRMNGWLALVVVSVIALVMALLVQRVFARDDGRYAASPLKPWFDSLRSGRGSCCSDADGWALADVDWESKDGHYRVRLPVMQFVPNASQQAPAPGTAMVWVDVPDDAVITEPNRAGRTMVWPIWGDGPTIRCFMPGAMT